MKVAECENLASMEVPSDTKEILPVTNGFKSRVKKWAYQNGFTLIFLTIMFFITWILLLFQNVLSDGWKGVCP